MPFDFDGDGYADLAVGVPGEDLRGKRDAGAVQVLYGSATGPTARDQVWHQGRKGVKNKLERADGFGDALASADFNADGFADLAIGIPREDIGSVKDTGAVQVLYGGPRGLTAQDQVWHQGSRGVPGSNERDDHFGSTLASGDFDADGYADLAIGSSGEDVGSVKAAGRVVVLRGGPRGLTSAGARMLGQGLGGIPSQPASGEVFGSDLAVSDVNGDGHDDLAIGVWAEADIPKEDVLGSSAVHLLWGSPSGVMSAGGQYIKATDIHWSGSPAPDMRFRLTFGDFNRDGRADLVLTDEWTASVLHGHPDGLHVAQLDKASTPGQDGYFAIQWYSEDDFLSSAAAGDITGDGYPDLAVVSNKSTFVILGSSAGLVADATPWAIPAPDVYETDVAVLQLSGGDHAWLAVSKPDASQYAGAVTVLQGTRAGTPGPVTVWSQDSPGIRGAAERRDLFGSVIGG